MQDRAITFKLSDVAGPPRSFSSLTALHSFFVYEANFWNAQRERLEPEKRRAHTFFNAGTNFENAAKAIDSWQEQLVGWSDDQLNSNLNQLRQNQLGNTPGQWLWSGQPCVEPFVQCALEHGLPTAEAFVDYVIRGQLNNLQEPQRFKGYLLAYEFLMQDSGITKRRSGEKVALAGLRSQFADARDSLIEETSSLKSDFVAWDKASRSEHERLVHVQKRLGERKLRKQGKAYNEQLKNWAHALANLEGTYQEKLRLEKPAEYWHKAARRYGGQGGLWLLAIVALFVVGVVNFQSLFTTWLQGKEIGLQFNSVQGVILFASIASVYAYLMRVLSRLAFSSFHLMRDAEEREQLTYLYLSLSNEAVVDEKSREIILQSLFSRSETGLLANEHGPTMPTLGEAIRSSAVR